MVYIKSSYDLEKIKQAAQIWKQVRAMLIEATKPGVSLITLNQKANDLITSLGGTCSFYKYRNFPKHICISVNDGLIHGVPDKYVLQPNDLVSFDVGVTYQGHVCDAAFTINLNPKNEDACKIDQATYQALMNAIKVVKAGNHVGDISHAIETTARTAGYEVIKDYSGHGCGNHVHEDPVIFNYGEPHTGAKLVKNMVLCIEPMFLTGSDAYYIDPKNGWTVKSLNHQLTCHWEHMVLVLEDGCEILTA